MTQSEIDNLVVDYQRSQGPERDAAFAKLVTATAGVVNGLCKATYMPSRCVDDLRQIAYLVMMEVAQRYDASGDNKGSGFGAVLTTAIRRRFIDERRLILGDPRKGRSDGSTASRKRRAILNGKSHQSVDEDAVASEPACPERTPAETAELKDEVAAAMRLLSHEQRQIVTLLAQGYSYADIGDKLGLPAEKVQIKTEYLRRQIKKQISRK